MKYSVLISTAVASLLLMSGATAQIPVEVFAGDQKVSLDVMFFKFFKNSQEGNSKFLFFNRTRSTVDYKMTSTTRLPAFGFTEALSYNHPKLKGFAPVAVVQIFNQGVFPKAGLQFAHNGKETLIFTWLVSETLKNPRLDYFLLFRYVPKLSEKVKLFTQLESSNSFPTVVEENWSLTQRIRLGLSIKEFQFGAGADFVETGNKSLMNTKNIGGFLRYEFK